MQASGPVSQSAYQRLQVGCEPSLRWAAFVPLLCQGAASVEELVFLHDVQAYRQTRCQNSRCQFGVLPPMGASLSGIGRLAAQPPLREARSDERLVAPSRSPPTRWSALEEFSERIRGKGAFLLLERLPLCSVRFGSVSQHGNADLSVETSSGACFGSAWTVDTAGAPSVCVLCMRDGCVRKAATWLILPVVICLSQRLSHACLSINCFIL